MPEPTGSKEYWRPVQREENQVFESPWINVFYDDIVHPNGDAGKYAWVRSSSGNGAVMTVPVTPSGKFLLIRVYRYPSNRYLWEFPAGLIEDGESPAEAASRELQEETGISSDKLEMLGSQIPIAGYVADEFHAVFVQIPEISIDEVELQRAEGIVDARLFTKAELIRQLQSEPVSDGITLTCLARYWMWKESN